MVPDDPAIAQAAELYLFTFAGRTDAYSVWTGDQWRAVRQPLTPEIILTAFRTKIPISGYVLAPDSTSHLAVLDIDREDGLDLGRQAVAHVHKLGGIAYVEASRRGSHIWIVMNASRPGVMIRTALRQLIIESGLPDDPKIELRPGQDHLSDESSLGLCIRMATMPHPTTGKRYVLVSGDGERLPSGLVDMMPAIELCPVEVVDDLAMRGPAPKIGPPPKGLRFPYGEPVVGDESASDILRDLWGAENAAPGKLIHCPTGMHGSRKTPSLHILKDDQRVLCFNPSCLLHNGGRGRGTHELSRLSTQRVGA
jgi:hypothetical protein